MEEPQQPLQESPAPTGVSKAELISKMLLPGAIIIAGIMISATILYTHGTGPSVGDKGQAQIAQKPVDIPMTGAPMLGNANAPVTVVEFADFQCPFCQRYFQNVESAIVANYINAGKVKFVWKDYAFLGQESLWAAEAARCANDQGKFWEYHDYLYAHQGQENSGAFSKVNLEKFARTLGLNATSFNRCLESDTYATAVKQETQYGNTIGVNGTPATYINGKLVASSDGRSVGAAPFSVFQAAIEAELKK